MTIPTRVFHRDLYARTATEVQNAYQMMVARELDFKDVTPEQRAWFMGARAMAAWVLGMPKGGAKIAQLVEGIHLRGALSLAPGSDFIDQARIVASGGFNCGS